MDDEVQASLDFLEQKVNRALGSISSMYSALSTGSTWARINGQILIPESVVETVIADNAITETKIDSDAVSTPKLQANAVTAGKLEANLVLSSKIIGGSYNSGLGQVYGVGLSSAGLELFDGGGVKRGWLKTDGSGWFGASDKLYWDTSGNITVAGVTVASAASGARTQLDVNGLRVFNSSNQVILEANSSNGFRTFSSTGATARAQLAMDGSGFLGSPDGTSGNAAISWNTAGTAVIKGAQIDSLSANKITTGTLNCSTLTVTNFSASSISTGSLSFSSAGTVNGASISGTFGNSGGTMNLGKLTVSDQLTLGAGGKIVDADGSTWDQTGLTLVSTDTFGDAIQWKVSGSAKGSIYASSSAFKVQYPSGGLLSLDAFGASLTAPTGEGFVISGAVMSKGKFYPGYSTSSFQSSYYLDAGTTIANGVGAGGGDFGIASGFTLNLVSPGTGGSAGFWPGTNQIGSTNAGYFQIKLGGSTYKVPFFV